MAEINIDIINSYIKNNDKDHLLEIIEQPNIDYLLLKKICDYAINSAEEGDSDILITMLESPSLLDKLDRDSIIDDIKAIRLKDYKLRAILEEMDMELAEFDDEGFDDEEYEINEEFEVGNRKGRYYEDD